MMDIYIKNMVCNRCIMVVSEIFEDAEITNAQVQLGKVSVPEQIVKDKLSIIETHLNAAGFEIINDSKSRLIEHIKNIIVDIIYNHKSEIKTNYSDYLADQLYLDYNYLSTLFSSIEGTTIEKYMINLKTERVKELLVYDHCWCVKN